MDPIGVPGFSVSESKSGFWFAVDADHGRQWQQLKSSMADTDAVSLFQLIAPSTHSGEWTKEWKILLFFLILFLLSFSQSLSKKVQNTIYIQIK